MRSVAVICPPEWLFGVTAFGASPCTILRASLTRPLLHHRALASALAISCFACVRTIKP